MNPEFSKLVQVAARIKATGRWDAANERLKHLAANPGKDNDWWVQVFGSLCFQVFSEYLLLKSAHEDPTNNSAPSLLAWRARNLLELSVWSIYCSKSKENARRLYEDAGRDAFGLFSGFTKWGVATAQDPKWFDALTGGQQELSQMAKADGIQSLDAPYKRVSDAAQECGVGLARGFSLIYKMLSKFAHPTAMQILAVPTERTFSQQKDMFFSQGCLFFTEAFESLEQAIS
jgi:hypothetical protein